MRYYSMAYFCTLIALATDVNTCVNIELDTQRDSRAERARRPLSADASVTNVQHLHNSYEERTTLDEYTCCAI
jgi:hypothetical protein